MAIQAENPRLVITFVILIIMFLGSCWEIAEQFLDLIYIATYFRDVIDSISI
ncbi:MAG: hypothetical protein LUQ17_02895 [Methanomicrobiales archaeon]|nr:hypothetical protein [Methanomicrobiales archaeon]